MNRITITHLFHSGFMIETEDHLLIFDYFNPGIPNISLSEEDIKDKHVYVFSTHSHNDHFDKKILEWNNYNKTIKYILSDDIILEHPKDNHIFMKPYQQKIMNDVTISTYGSTDLGVSFLVEVDGFVIFHAGDLNWWHWKDMSKKGHRQEKKLFKYHVNKLKGTQIDVAFIPVDPRCRFAH